MALCVRLAPMAGGAALLHVAFAGHAAWAQEAVAIPADAQPGAAGAAVSGMGEDTALSFDAASVRLSRTSATLQAASHSVASAEQTAKAVSALNRPLVTVSAQYLEYQKTLSLDLKDARQSALDSTQDFLGTLPSTLPPGYQQIASEITGKISAALPGLFGALPDSLSYRYRDDVFRPSVQAVLPLYTGGAITAIKRGASAGVAAAQAKEAEVQELAQINLIRVYFGQHAAQALEASAKETRDALDRLLYDAQRLEAAGFTPRARTLEAQVARDGAERAYQRAILAHQSARMELAQVLELGGVRPTTPLFVATRPLEPANGFLDNGDDTSQTRQAIAAGKLADAGVALAKSQFRPQAFAFGSYNFNKDDALPTDPDWVVGVGVRYTLLSNIDRGHALAAAREKVAAADEATRAARNASTIAVLRAWDMVEAARRSFVLLDSSMAAAQENLRVQSVAFREGEGTLTTVLAAEAALSAARTQRIATAYEYDLALAGLLAASGRLPAFSDHMNAADVKLPLGAGR